jgi:hypothetical protein
MKFLILATLLIFHFQSQAKIYGPKRYDYKGLVGFVSADVFSASENFDTDGEAVSLNSSGEYLLAEFPFGVRHLMGSAWAVEGEMKASYASSNSSTAFTGGERTNSQIHELRFSTDYIFPMQAFDLIPEFEFVMPFDTIGLDSDDVLVNEGAQTMSLKLHLQTEFGASDFFGYLGYSSRGEGRSNLLPWSVALGRQSRSILWGGRLFGFQSISDDSDTNAPLPRLQFIERVNAGAARFFGINPSSVAAEGFFHFDFSKTWKVQTRLGLDLAGESYSKGIFAGVTLLMDFGPIADKGRRRVLKENAPRRARGNGIAIEPDSIDFKEETQEQGDEQEYFAPPPAIKVKPTNRINNGPSSEDIQNQMNDVEMKIELKKKRKK